jgi:hypothetical protein
MDVASLCACPVGIVPWLGPEPLLTIVVKATFGFGADGVASLAQPQDALSVDRAHALGIAGTLAYATDFVPRKARADVLVVGHAQAPVPTTAIAGRIAVGPMSKSIVAVVAQPSTRIPLAGAFVREAPPGAALAGPLGAPNPELLRGPVGFVGPRTWFAARAASPVGDRISPQGPPLAPLSRGFDYGLFNVAPPDQQLAELRADTVIEIDGLLPRALRWRVTLPGIEPLVFLTSAGDEAEEVSLCCDTLVVDLDRACCTLVFRGVVPMPVGSPRLVVTLRSAQHRPTWANVKPLLGAAQRGVAATALPCHDGAASGPKPRAAAQPFSAGTPALPPSPAPARRPPSRLGLETVMADPPPSGPALPFGSAPGPAPVDKKVFAATITADAGSVGDAMPFQPGPAPDQIALPSRAPARRARSPFGSTIALEDDPRTSQTPTPFGRPVPPAVPAPPPAPLDRCDGAAIGDLDAPMGDLPRSIGAMEPPSETSAPASFLSAPASSPSRAPPDRAATTRCSG